MDRKTFINSIVRLSIMGFLVVLTGFLLTRRKVSRAGGCTANPVCSNCPALAGCKMKEAVKQRRNG